MSLITHALSSDPLVCIILLAWLVLDIISPCSFVFLTYWFRNDRFNYALFFQAFALFFQAFGV